MKDWNLSKPALARFRVDYLAGHGWVVFDPDGNFATKPTPFRNVADHARAELQAEADRKAKRGLRPCMCCGQTFVSAGIHNRLCGSCGTRGDVLGEPCSAGGQTGQKPRKPRT